MTRPPRWAAWLLMAVVLSVGLVVAAQPDEAARTPEDRIFAIARATKCPTCRSQSVAESESPIAKEIRADIARRIEAGESDDEIRDFLRSRFGEEVELRPSASGVTGLVWVIPVVAFVVSSFGLAMVFRRWRRSTAVAATDEDRALVAEARGTAVKEAGPVDPDAYAALEEQRDFLLRSLDDLEREHDAGDVDDVDYEALKDDYTARAAAVLRALDDGQARFRAARTTRSWPRLAAVLVVVALLAAGAGVLLARSSGTRGSNDQISGDIRLTNRDRLLRAQELISPADPDPVAALELFDEVLATDPDNAEALTYRGWTLALSGLTDEAIEWLDRAVEADPDFPDARALRAVVLANGLNRPEDALADLEALDPATTPPDIAALVEPLRERLLAQVEGSGGDPEDPPPG